LDVDSVRGSGTSSETDDRKADVNRDNKHIHYSQRDRNRNYKIVEDRSNIIYVLSESESSESECKCNL